MRIGDIEILPPVALAPMAGTTNHAFRLICKRLRAGIVWTEMISSYGIRYGNPKTLAMFDWTDEEKPVVAQIFGGEPGVMAAAAKKVESAGADVIDINLGCPVPKVQKTGAGIGLTRDLARTRDVIKSVVEAVRVPVTVKIRKGLDDRRLTAVDVARIAEDAGAKAVAIHARTAAQGYSGRADWSAIAKVKEAVRITVIGNGDVRAPEDAKRMLEETGCDGLMIGRGALGNPWIFEQTAHYLETGRLLPQPGFPERVEVALHHLSLLVELFGEARAVREMRGQVPFYVKGIPGAARIRSIVNEATTAEELRESLQDAIRNSQAEPKEIRSDTCKSSHS